MTTLWEPESFRVASTFSSAGHKHVQTNRWGLYNHTLITWHLRYDTPDIFLSCQKYCVRMFFLKLCDCLSFRVMNTPAKFQLWCDCVMCVRYSYHDCAHRSCDHQPVYLIFKGNFYRPKIKTPKYVFCHVSFALWGHLFLFKVMYAVLKAYIFISLCM